MDIALSIIATIGYLAGGMIIATIFWFGVMWWVSTGDRKREANTVARRCTPEAIHEACVEMTKKERRKLAKKRFKNMRDAKKIAQRWHHDAEAQRWLDEHPNEVA